jgi:hypothetical protein
MLNVLPQFALDSVADHKTMQRPACGEYQHGETNAFEMYSKGV